MKLRFFTLVAALFITVSTVLSQVNCPSIIYVTPSGNVATAGTIGAPTNLAKALTLVTASRHHIKMLSGVYTSADYDVTFNVPSNTVIDGSYEVDINGEWVKNSSLNTTIQVLAPFTSNSGVGHYVAFQLNGVSNVYIKDVNIVNQRTASGTTGSKGRSVYGIHVSNTSNFFFTRLDITTGNASAGLNGANGISGGNGFAGRGGHTGDDDGSSCGGNDGQGGNGNGAGGAGATGATTCNGSTIGGTGQAGTGVTAGGGGGGGGAGGTDTGADGRRGGRGGNGGGGAGGGTFGNGGTTPSSCNGNDGGNGATGATGANGVAGTTIPVFSFAQYFLPANQSASGTSGAGGAGGGGGGGGGGDEDDGAFGCFADDGSGAGGGGGGGGGSGGTGGTGGFGGGGSFGVYAQTGNSGDVLQDLNISTGSFGAGGTRGFGGVRGFGGLGGIRGLGSGGSTAEVGAGGLGGNGGAGGNGGNGANGRAGVSIATSGVTRTGTTVPNPRIVTASTYGGCTNSEIDITKNAGVWTLTGASFVNNLNTAASAYTTASASATISYTSTGHKDLIVDGVTYKNFIYIQTARALPVVSNTVPTTACSGVTVPIATTTSGSQYEWVIFVATNNTNTPVATYTTASATWTPPISALDVNYRMRLRVKETCCGWSAPVYHSITIYGTDVTPPVPDAPSLANLSGQCSVGAPTAPTATDFCSGAITGVTTASFPITTQGTTVVTWTYTDAAGNSSTQTQNVVVNDNTAPVPNTGTLATINSLCSVPAPTSPTATDNCSGTITGVASPSFPINTQGTTVVTWTYTDAEGNSSSQTQNVVVTDNIAPVANAPGLVNLTSQCIVTAPTAPTANDNCSGLVTGVASPTFPISTQGTTAVTWTYTDAVGNSSTQTQNVIITDATAPVADVASLTNLTGQCSVAAPTSPTATDNCNGSITGVASPAFPITTQGTTAVTWTFTDAVGNSTSQIQNVTVTDNTAPVADAGSLSTLTGQCTVNAPTAPTATDNCSGSVTGVASPAFPITTQGTTAVTWTFTDAVGNSSTQMQSVTITDNIAPVADAGSLTTLTGQCTVAAPTAPTATDNCSGSVIGVASPSFPITTQGTTMITWTFTDGVGNTSTQMQNVTITDNVAPVADAGSLTTLTGQCTVAAPTAPTATDNCSGSVTGIASPAFPITTQGTTMVTWTFTDAAGNSSSQMQSVTITDNIAPVADAGSLIALTGQCSVAAPSAPTATDNCSGSVTGIASPVFPITTQGTTMVTWTFTDAVGNSSTQMQSVTITDNIAPVADAVSLTTLTGQCSVASPTAPTATDNCNGSIAGVASPSFPITTQGTTVITWTYTDAVGNSSTQTQNVVITDNIAPVADAGTLANLTGQCSVTAPTTPTATDNCSGSITGVASPSFPITTQGTTVITWTYTDAVGNSSTQTQNVVITDNIVPVADAGSLAALTGQCSVVAPTAPTATDNCSGGITGVASPSFPITTQGTTVVTWTYTDAVGNSSTQTQNVVITDNIAPVADAGSLTALTGQCSVAAPSAPTATDNCSGSVTGVASPSFPITTQGTTVVTWTFTDAAGNSSTQMQNVIITDVTAPVADVSALADLIGQCTVIAPTAPTATDNCDGSVTGVASPSFPITAQGTTVVTWTFTDAVGNSSTQMQNVIITDVTAPVADVASLTGLSGSCSVAAPTAPTATDNCDGSITGVASPSFPITAQGTTVVTWTYTDAVGNSSTQTQSVTISDATPPVVSCTNISVYLNVAGTAVITGADIDGGSTDNCGIATLIPSQVNFTCADIGANTIILNVTDNSGNTGSCNSTVTVIDTIRPLVVCQNVTVQLDAAGNGSIVSADIDNGSSDACGINTYALSQTNFDCSNVGANNVTLVITDNYGNIDSCIAVVTVEDNISPTVSCPGDFDEFLDVNCDFTIPDYSSLVTALDNCSSGTTLVISQAPVAGVVISSAQTNQLITITATDNSGNQSSCAFTITLVDTLVPTFDCPSDQEVTTSADCIYQIEDYTDLISNDMDNCDNSNLTITQIPAAGTFVTAGPTSSAGYDGQTLVQIIAEDLSGNIDTCDFIVDLICEDELFIPGFFSPNDDNKNDLFVIDGLDNFPNNNIQIFNRWGNKVFEMDDYNGNWNGVSEGAFTIGVGPLPSGTYFYILDLGDGSKAYNGYVELQR